MGAVTGALGLGGGPGGSATNMTNATGANQIAGAQSGVQYGLGQLNSLADATGAGVQNQQNVYKQLQGVANGTGPNPAQAMLNQSTGQNVANQAALAAGQRGAAGNVGLMARQAAQQGSAAQQTAAGQGATMQANQSLNALEQMGGIANTQAGNQLQATTADTQAQLANLQAQQGAQAAYNSAQSGVASAQAGASSGLAGSALGGAAQGVAGAIGLAQGGYAGDMGAGTPAAQGGQMMASGGPVSAWGQFMNGMSQYSQNQNSHPGQQGSNYAQNQLGQQIGSGLANAVGSLFSSSPQQAQPGITAPQQAPNAPVQFQAAKGGKVPVKLSPQEKVLPPGKAEQFAKGGPMRASTVPGKPKVPGKNDYANDTYSTQLKPGSIVIPLESLHSNEDARRFVQATLSKKGKK